MLKKTSKNRNTDPAKDSEHLQSLLAKLRLRFDKHATPGRSAAKNLLTQGLWHIFRGFGWLLRLFGKII